jgi:predicted GNAT family acetyltransferase
MDVRRCQTAGEFLERAGDFLVAREAEHNLIIGLAGRLRENAHIYGEEPPYFAVAEDGGRVVAVAMRTPPHNLIVSEVDDESALDVLAEDVRATYSELPGVLGPTAAAERFVSLWGAPGERRVAQRAHRAETVTLPEGVSGRIRAYEEGDRELVLRWLHAFIDEALGGEGPETAEGSLEHRLADPDGDFKIWEDGGEPVSLAGYGSTTPNGIRVGPVYTPPELRRRGYATALTAEVTKMLLESGRRFCFLFTDLANPTSNSIYYAVGYRPVTDIDMWRFTTSR